MKKYEIVYIIHPDLEGSTAKITEKVKKDVEGLKGKVISSESWGKKKLAYEIKHNAYGIYEFLVIEMDPAKIKEVERSLRLSEEIIRQMVVLVEEKEKSGIEAPRRKPAVRKAPVEEKKEAEKAPEKKKTKAEEEKEEKERQKELDEKLKEIIGD